MKSILALVCTMAIFLAVSGQPIEEDKPPGQPPPLQPPAPNNQPKPPADKEGEGEEEEEEGGSENGPEEEGKTESGELESDDVEDTSVVKESDEVVQGPRNSAEKVQEQAAEEHANLFEGDIKLTKKQEKQLDNLMSDKKETITGKGRAFIGKKWPNGRVPFEFARNFDRRRINTVRAAIREFNKKTCIKFVPKRSTDRTWVKFIVDDNKCYSRLGHVSMRGQPISIGGGCNFVGTVIHEMMHCIGFFHEQSRRDRDAHVEIIEDNIDTDRFGEGIKSNFAMYLQGEGDSLGEPYDLGSIMHYPNTAFGKTDSRGNLMITIRSRVNPNMRLGQRNGFSESDLKQINMLYGCKKSS